MALTGPRITASIYGIDRGFGLKDIPGAFNGRVNEFTNTGQIKFYVPPLGTTANGVTMNGVIEETPGGLNQPKTKYYTSLTPAQIITNGS